MERFRLRLWFLGLFFYPLLFFTVKFISFDISFFKLLAIISFLLHGIISIVNTKISVHKFYIIFFVFTILSLLINDISSRLLLNILSYFVVLSFAVTGAALFKDSDYNDIKKYFSIVVKGWYILLYLGLIQLILSFFGVDMSWESIGEPSPENKGYFLGSYLLRPASVYGEPRDFSAFVVLIPCLYAFINKGREIKWSHLLFFVALGLSSQSTTFFLVMSFYLFVIYRTSLIKIFAFSSLFGLLFTFLLPFLKVLIPRLYFVESFSLDMLNTPLFAEQAGDLSFVFYIIHSNIVQLIFGNGIGTSSYIISLFTDTYMFTKSEYLYINSRWLFYTWLVDFGVLVLVLVGVFIKNNLPKCRVLKSLSLLSLGTSLFTGSLIFVFIILILKRLDYGPTKE